MIDTSRLAWAKLEDIVENSEDAILSKNLDGIITSWNTAAERLFGYRAEEILGQPITLIIPPERLSEEATILARLRNGERIDHYDTVRRTKDARLINVSLTVSPLRDSTGQIVGASKIIRDITRRKKAEAEVASLSDRLATDLQAMNRLHQLSTRFVRGDDVKTLLEAILDAAIAITNADKGNIQLLNITFGELDVAANRGFDQPFIEFFSHIRPGVAACGTAMQTRECVVVEDVTLSPVFLATPRALELMLSNGVRAVVCTPLLTRTGQTVGVLSTHYAVPSKPSERDLHLLDMLARQAADFVERLHFDQALQAARDELAQANADLERKVQERTAKLQETIGELEYFSYTLAHDMRAPLRAMQGFADVLLKECGNCLNADRKDYLRRIAAAADRMDNLIIDALDYSKAIQKEIPLHTVDADALLRGILESYPAFQTPNAEIEISGSIPLVMGNQAALTQCFSNLLGNAIKFVKPGIAPKIRVWAEERSTPNPVVRLWFEDNGIGIAQESQNRIFEMFQRLNKEYEGTGIGLALVRKVIQRMGGQVGVASESGKGSRFWLDLIPAHR